MGELNAEHVFLFIAVPLVIAAGLLIIGLLLTSVVDEKQHEMLADTAFNLPAPRYETDLSTLQIMCERCQRYGTVGEMKADAIYGTVHRVPCTPQEAA